MTTQFDFDSFKATITEIYQQLKDNNDGKVADYIPQLAKVNPDLFGISVCTIAGEHFDLGDTEIEFCVQSCSKPLTYCIARELNQVDQVHSHVGYEPSGQSFNAFVLDSNGHPHNPMINAGSIMVCSLIESNQEPANRFETVRAYLYRMAGKNYRIGFDNGVFLSERQHADRNYALAYFMNERQAFPPNTNLRETLDLYFQACSVTVNCTAGAVITATLANSGVCPLTQDRIYTSETIRDCLSLMYQCGMYDYSGQFAFKVGLPAKSGVSGCLFLVIPNLMGICIWSPRLDQMGNSVRGVLFCQELIRRYQHFHIFNQIIKINSPTGLTRSSPSERRPDLSTSTSSEILTQLLISAASQGKDDQIRELVGRVEINVADYDGRTALHLAAAEGKLSTVKLLLELEADPNPLDRWGNTPYHEVTKLITGQENNSLSADKLNDGLQIQELLKQHKESDQSSNHSSS